MEAILFIGLQGAGKTSLFQSRFFRTHVHISLDLLKTRHREMQFIELCLTTRQRFVVDNTNPSREARLNYIQAAKRSGFAVTGYYFQSLVEDCLRRNASRSTMECVPETAILNTAKKLQTPARDEGFDQLFYVRLQGHELIVEDWRDEI